jgi:hypothetical protein
MNRQHVTIVGLTAAIVLALGPGASADSMDASHQATGPSSGVHGSAGTEPGGAVSRGGSITSGDAAVRPDGTLAYRCPGSTSATGELNSARGGMADASTRSDAGLTTEDTRASKNTLTACPDADGAAASPLTDTEIKAGRERVPAREYQSR